MSTAHLTSPQVVRDCGTAAAQAYLTPMLTFVSTISFVTLIAVMIVPKLLAMASPRARMHAEFVATVSAVAICLPGALFLLVLHWWTGR